MSSNINSVTAQTVRYNMVSAVDPSEAQLGASGNASRRRVQGLRRGLRLLRRKMWARWVGWFDSAATWIIGALLIAILGAALAQFSWPTQPAQNVISEPLGTSVKAKHFDTSLDSDWTSQARIGHDSQGRQAHLRLLVLSRDFQWRYGSDTVVEQRGHQYDIRPHLRSNGISTLVANAKAIIAVGAASEQGSLAVEALRADARAQQLALWVREESAITQPVFALNLGRYIGFNSGIKTGGSPAATSSQRSIAIVSVVASDPGIDLPSALRNALTNETPSFPFFLKDYSTFTLTQLR